MESGRMNVAAVRDHLANVARSAFRPHSGLYEAFALSPYALLRLETELDQRGKLPNRPNAKDLAFPVLCRAMRNSAAYVDGDSPLCELSPRFCDVVDLILVLGVADTRGLIRRLRPMAEELANHCWDRGIVVQIGDWRERHARLRVPRFSCRLLVQGAAKLARTDHQDLLDSARRSKDPFLLLEHALEPAEVAAPFVSALKAGQEGSFGNRFHIAKQRQRRRRKQRVAVA